MPEEGLGCPCHGGALGERGGGEWSGHRPVLFLTGRLGSHEQEAEVRTGAQRRMREIREASWQSRRLN